MAKAKKSRQDKADIVMSQFESARSEYSTIGDLHQQCMTYVMPRKSNVTETKTPGSDDWSENLYDDEAINGTQVLASGSLDWLFSGRWMGATAPWLDAPQSVKDWYTAAGEICLKLINQSNFPLEIHEFLLDRSAAATAHLHCEEDDEDILFFMNDDVGEYYIRDNEKGYVDTWLGKRIFTVRNAVKMFGEENVGKSVADAYDKANGEGMDEEFEFLYSINPRDEADRLYGKRDKENKPWALMIVQSKDKFLVEEGGYDEQPFFVSRYLKWGRSPYGYGPTMLALPIIRQINGIEKLMDALAELQAFPRILIPSDLEGMVGFGPSGVTVYNANNGQHGKPTEWATQGRYDIGKDRANDIRSRIRRAYHVELFQMLTGLEEMKREKTATEVRAMLAEKVSHFSPTFTRLQVEILKPLLNRVFSIAYRKGLLPPLPEEILQFTGTSKLQFPEFIYTSKLALAIRAHENLSWNEFMLTLGDLFQLDATLLEDNINKDRTIRRLGDNVGLPVEMWNTEDEKAKIREDRAALQEAEASMTLAESASNVAKNVGNLPQMANLT